MELAFAPENILKSYTISIALEEEKFAYTCYDIISEE